MTKASQLGSDGVIARNQVCWTPGPALDDLLFTGIDADSFPVLLVS